jgi:hypothetical protein
VLTELFTAVTSRVICLVQREAGFEFEVQPLREYFASRYIFENSTGDTRDDCLSALLRRPYWSNVLRFFAGHLSRMEVRGVPSNLRTVLDEEPFDRLPLCRATAGQLLNDQLFLGHRSVPIRDAVDVALDGPGAVLADDALLDVAGGRFVLSEETARDQVAAHCKDRLMTEPDPFVRAALARLLVAHGDRADLRQWWWDEATRAASPAWLSTAADLGALSGLRAGEVEHLLACGAPSHGEPLVAALLRAGSDTDDPTLLARCAAELGDAPVHYRAASADSGTAVERLCTWSHPDLFRTAPPSGRGRRRRIRLRRGAGAADTAGRLEALHRAPGTHGTSHWLSLLDVLQEGFGDCWLLRECALAMPPELLPAGSAPPSILTGASRDELLAWMSEAHARRKDIGWWLDHQPPSDDPLAVRTWALATVATASAAVLVEAVAGFSNALEELPASASAALVLAAHRHGSSPAARRLDLRDAVRLRKVVPTPTAALLLYPVAFETTQEQLAPYVYKGLNDLLLLGAPVAALALPVSATLKTTPPVDAFKGSRSAVSSGVILRATGAAKPTFRLAREILAEPHVWPSDIVALAVDRLAERLARQEPLSAVAASNDWFAD